MNNDLIQQYATTQHDSITLIAVQEAMPRESLNRTQNTALGLSFLAFFVLIFVILKIRGNHLIPNAIALFQSRKQLKLIQDAGIRANILSYMLGIILSYSILSVVLIFGFHKAWTFSNLIITLGYLIGWHIFALLILCGCRWIFNATITGYESICTLWNYNILIGIFAAPIVLAMLFVENFAVHYALYIIYIYLFLFYFMKFYRGVKIISTNGVSILYLILYLCTLEVIPFLFIYKIWVQPYIR